MRIVHTPFAGICARRKKTVNFYYYCFQQCIVNNFAFKHFYYRLEGEEQTTV